MYILIIFFPGAVDWRGIEWVLRWWSRLLQRMQFQRGIALPRIFLWTRPLSTWLDFEVVVDIPGNSEISMLVEHNIMSESRVRLGFSDQDQEVPWSPTPKYLCIMQFGMLSFRDYYKQVSWLSQIDLLAA